jgi:hypothetical protein
MSSTQFPSPSLTVLASVARTSLSCFSNPARQASEFPYPLGPEHEVKEASTELRIVRTSSEETLRVFEVVGAVMGEMREPVEDDGPLERPFVDGSESFALVDLDNGGKEKSSSDSSDAAGEGVVANLLAAFFAGRLGFFVGVEAGGTSCASTGPLERVLMVDSGVMAVLAGAGKATSSSGSAGATGVGVAGFLAVFFTGRLRLFVGLEDGRTSFASAGPLERVRKLETGVVSRVAGGGGVFKVGTSMGTARALLRFGVVRGLLLGVANLLARAAARGLRGEEERSSGSSVDLRLSGRLVDDEVAEKLVALTGDPAFETMATERKLQADITRAKL